MILKCNFSCLYYLVDNKRATIAEIYSLGWGEDGWVWKWQRKLLASEEDQVRECCKILINIVLQPNMGGSGLHDFNNYNISSSYNYMLSSINILAVDHTYAIWNNEVPLKVSLFAWCLLHNWLPTTDNLIRRHVLQSNAQFCTGDYGIMEDINHLFLSCDFFSNWLRFLKVHLEHVEDHFLQFENLCRFPKNTRATFQLIWLSHVWVICEK